MCKYTPMTISINYLPRLFRLMVLINADHTVLQ